jgi:hypothetical protein
MYERMHDEIGAERRRPCGHAGARRDSASSRAAGILSNGPTPEFFQARPVLISWIDAKAEITPRLASDGSGRLSFLPARRVRRTRAAVWPT